jgi:hypothetical protein
MPVDDNSRSPDEYFRCRTFGHAWFDVDSDWKPSLGTPLTLRCERCTMERRDTISRNSGALITRHYYRPPAYQYAKGERPSMAEFRLMVLSSRINEARRERRLRAATEENVG